MQRLSTFTATTLVAGLLWATAAVAADPPKSVPAPTKEVLELGRAVFTTNCVPCHGALGDGAGPVGVTLNPRPRDFAHEPFKQGNAPEQIFKTISEGLPGTLMVAWPQLSEAERWAAAHYVTTLLPKPAEPTPAAKGKAKKK